MLFLLLLFSTFFLGMISDLASVRVKDIHVHYPVVFDGHFQGRIHDRSISWKQTFTHLIPKFVSRFSLCCHQMIQGFQSRHHDANREAVTGTIVIDR
jgi:hypothetical protein